MNHQEEKWKVDTIWNGYCPECWLNGKSVRMKLNSDDFFECETSRLQIVLSFPGVQATILKFRGKGKFRTKPEFADELPSNEFLSRQSLESYPFTDTELFEDSDEIESYIINEIK